MKRFMKLMTIVMVGGLLISCGQDNTDNVDESETVEVVEGTDVTETETDVDTEMPADDINYEEFEKELLASGLVVSEGEEMDEDGVTIQQNGDVHVTQAVYDVFNKYFPDEEEYILLSHGGEPQGKISQKVTIDENLYSTLRIIADNPGTTPYTLNINDMEVTVEPGMNYEDEFDVKNGETIDLSVDSLGESIQYTVEYYLNK